MLNVIQITDTHLFADPAQTMGGVTPDLTLKAVLSAIKQLNPPVDLLLVTGDIAHENPSAYPRIKDYVSQLGIPVHYLPGNHDQPEIMHNVLENTPENGVHHFTTKRWLIIMLDTTIAGRVEGKVTDTQLQKLVELIHTHENFFVLLAIHHHPVSIGSAWMETIGLVNGAEFLQIIARFANIKGIIFGHIHQPFAAEIKGIAIYGTPSTCFQFKPNSPSMSYDNRPPAYRQLLLHDNGDLITKVVYISRN
jgi:Icc protein